MKNRLLCICFVRKVISLDEFKDTYYKMTRSLFKTDKSKSHFLIWREQKLKLDRPSPKKWSIQNKTILSFVHTDNH